MRVHVIGAGLAGLAAATRLSEQGVPVTLHEATGHAGGRCRSYLDKNLGVVIDNGTHLIIGAYEQTFHYVRRIGSEDLLTPAPAIDFPMADPTTDRRWHVGVNRGFLGSPLARGIAGDLLRLSMASPEASVAESLGDGPRMTDFWSPLVLAVFNTPPSQSSARLLARTAWRAMTRGVRPYFAPAGLGAALVDPALGWLRERGAEIRFHHRLTTLNGERTRISALLFGKECIPLDDKDRIILALPSQSARRLLGSSVPSLESAPIVNVHFRLPPDVGLDSPLGFLGLVGTTAQWAFQREDVLSVTVSAAQSLSEMPAQWIAAEIWKEVVPFLTRPCPLPVFRVVKEKAATILQSGSQDRLRPSPQTPFANLLLAGDWLQTGLPATIESAIISGHKAADWHFSS